MSETLPIVLIIVLVLLTVVLLVVGIQIVLTLVEVRKTLTRANGLITDIEQKIDDIAHPLKNLGGVVGGLQTGFKLFEGFVGWLSHDKNRKD